jgi:ribonuclease VapC
MIAVDTSALMAIILREPQAQACAAALSAEDELLISAGTLTEAFVVAAGRNVSAQIAQLIEGLDFEVVPATVVVAKRIEQAYRRWGKGMHAAGLNFGDCFAYDVAKEHACRLLYVGNDFSKTDIESVL